MSNAALAADYLFLAPLIVDRLLEQIGENIPVEGIEAMAQAREAQDLRELVLYVMWGGDRIVASESGRSGNGSSQALYQRWIVWARVRNASTTNKAARNGRAGPLLSAVHKALAGWTPAGAHRALVRTQAPAPDYQPASGMYPLAFEINLVL